MNWHQLLKTDRPRNKTSVQNTSRNEYEKDIDRIIFSHPFRKLQDKTQVVPLPEHDFVHTRLTHSLEVSSVGATLGKLAGEFILEQDPSLVEKGLQATDFRYIIQAACLAHDIGNPPFGHSGESGISSTFSIGALNCYKEQFNADEWFDLCNFEGNAQGFRILMQKGLLPTYAVLGAFIKYPCLGNIGARAEKAQLKKSQKKYNFFITEKQDASDYFEALEISKHSGTDFSYVRHPLVFLTEAADDICYLVIDFEDAARMDIISEETYYRYLSPICKEKLNLEKLLATYTDKNERLGLVRALAINQLIHASIETFKQNYTRIMEGKYENSLVDDGIFAEITENISKFSRKHIYNSARVVELQAAGFEILPRLTEQFCGAVIRNYLNEAHAKDINLLRLLPFETNKQISLYENVRYCLDFIAGLTDRHALQLHRKLLGVHI